MYVHVVPAKREVAARHAGKVMHTSHSDAPLQRDRWVGLGTTSGSNGEVRHAGLAPTCANSPARRSSRVVRRNCGVRRLSNR